MSTTDEEGELGSIGSDLDEQIEIDEKKKAKELIKKPGGKRPRGKRGGKKGKEEGKKGGKQWKKTGRAAELLASLGEGGNGDEKVVNFGGKSREDRPRNLWYKKLEKKRRNKPKHQI